MPPPRASCRHTRDRGTRNPTQFRRRTIFAKRDRWLVTITILRRPRGAQRFRRSRSRSGSPSPMSASRCPETRCVRWICRPACTRAGRCGPADHGAARATRAPAGPKSPRASKPASTPNGQVGPVLVRSPRSGRTAIHSRRVASRKTRGSSSRANGPFFGAGSWNTPFSRIKNPATPRGLVGLAKAGPMPEN